MEGQQTVRPGGGGEREVPPDPRPPRRLHRRVLSGPVRVGLVGPDRDHRDVPGHPLVRHHLALPPGRRGLRGAVGGVDHDRGDQPVRPAPRQLGRAVPAAARVPGQGRQQALTHRAVVVGQRSVLAVPPAQSGQVLGQPDRVGRAAGRLEQCPEQTVALEVHGRREQRPDLGAVQEEQGVEVRGGAVRDRLDDRQAAPDQLDVPGGRRLLGPGQGGRREGEDGSRRGGRQRDGRIGIHGGGPAVIRRLRRPGPAPAVPRPRPVQAGRVGEERLRGGLRRGDEGRGDQRRHGRPGRDHQRGHGLRDGFGPGHGRRLGSVGGGGVLCRRNPL